MNESATPQTYPLLPGLMYYDNYITDDLEDYLLQGIHQHPRAWKQLKNRKLQNWGGLPHIKGMIQTPLPVFLHPIINQLTQSNFFPSHKPPNHVLINHYAPGQGIDPHVDGPAYYPVAAIISLKSALIMDFFSPSDQRVASLILRPRSLLLLSEDVYHNFHHAISPRTTDLVDQLTLNPKQNEPISTIIHRKERISLTVRASCKTINNSLLGFSKKALSRT